MTAPASPTDRQPLQLNDEQRDAMTRELFTHWRSTEPDTSHCFCGDDSDLVDALQAARASHVQRQQQAQQQREREDDEPEL